MTGACPYEHETNPFELIPMILDAARRRALWFLVPVILGAAASVYIVYTSQHVYTASANILLDIANQTSPLEQGTMRFNNNSAPANQVQAIEAWMKSDTVIDELLEHLLEGPLPASEEDRVVVRANLRRSLNFQLVGNSILLITLEDPQKEGLAHKLEFVVTRLMDGLMRPNKGLLSGPQLILLYYQEAADAARRKFFEAMRQARQQDNDAIYSTLKEVQSLMTQAKQSSRLGEASSGIKADRARFAPSAPIATEKARSEPVVPTPEMSRVTKIADDLSMTARQLLDLAELDKTRRIAEAKLSAARESYNTNDRSYLPIFATPEKLALMGRPRDPISGKIGGRKLAAIIALFSIMLGFSMAFVRELLDRRVRISSEAVRAMGLPVIARVPRVSGAGR